MREGAGDGIRGGALLCGGLGYVVPMIGLDDPGSGDPESDVQ